MEGRATRLCKNHTVQSLLIAIISYLLRAKGQTLSLSLRARILQEHAALRKPEGDAWEKEGKGLFRKGKKKREEKKKVNLAFRAQS